jgi:hypothetical protein
MEDGLSCLTEASTNTQGAGALRDRKPDAGLASRLAHVRCALLCSVRAQSPHILRTAGFPAPCRAKPVREPAPLR